MNRKKFAQVIETRGWEYVLTRVDPDSISDAILGEALSDAQDAFHALLTIAPSVDDFDQDRDLTEYEDVLDEEESEDDDDSEDLFGQGIFEREDED